jgi:acylphosphatase
MTEPHSSRIAKRYVIKGRVQGVGFRYFALMCAEREGIEGWVRNTADGGVEVEAEADAAALARFEEQLRVGPRSGRVDQVVVSELPATSTRGRFRVR